MVAKPARPTAARELRRLLHDSDGPGMAGMAHAIYVNRLCHSGQSVEYRTYRSRDHLSLIWPGSRLVPYLLAWTQARLAARPQESGCSVAER
jgi:hypothetical protein